MHGSAANPTPSASCADEDIVENKASPLRAESQEAPTAQLNFREGSKLAAVMALLRREGGVTIKGWLQMLTGLDAKLAASKNADIAVIRATLASGAKAVAECVDYIVATAGTDPKAAFAGAVPFLRLMGIVSGGWQMARAALVAEKKLAEGAGDAAFYKTKITTARFFADHVLVEASGLADIMVKGSAGVMAVAEEDMLAG